MINFYQSNEWKNINIGYGREIFEWEYKGKKWRGTIKSKWGQKWYQTIGIEGYTKEDYQYIKKNILNQGFFVQLGILDKGFGGIKSFIHNMPDGTIVYKTNDGINQWNTNSKRLLKKAQSYNIFFKELEIYQREEFYQKWKETLGNKGIMIPNKDQYYSLFKHNLKFYIIENEKKEIIAGHIYSIVDNTIVYLYGFVVRNELKGIGQYMIWNVLNTYPNMLYDTRGCCKKGAGKEDSLFSVTQFKESMGGERIEYYGNIDFINNYLLYYLFKGFYYIKRLGKN